MVKNAVSQYPEKSQQFPIIIYTVYSLYYAITIVTSIKAQSQTYLQCMDWADTT